MTGAIRPETGAGLHVGTAVIVVTRRLDRSSVPQVREDLSQAIEREHGDVVLDLATVEWVDTTGLGLLVSAHRRLLLQQRRLVLRGCRPRVRRALAMTRLNRVLRLEPNLGQV